MICPVCKGPKSKRARLCSRCRRSAIAAGVQLLTAQPAAARPPAAQRLRTPEQNRAYHGKCGAIAQLTGSNPRDVKASALARAGELFSRAIESSSEMTEIEMDRLLDELDRELVQLEQR